MERIPKLASIVYLLCVVTLGCGRPNGPPTPDEADNGTLLEIGEMYRSYQAVKNRPPANLSELGSMKAVSSNAYEAVRRGDIILRYGATMTDLKEESGPPTSGEILAYQKEVPEKGGKVLMLDRNVKSMTADEFTAAKKIRKN